MQKKLKLLLLFMLITTAACTCPRATIRSKHETELPKVAVLTFKSTGFLSSQKLGKVTADEVASALVHRAKADVVDRSVVNSIMVKSEITSLDVITASQLQKIAKSIDVQLILLGEIRSINSGFLGSLSAERLLMVSFRLVDPGHRSYSGPLLS